MGWRYRSYVHRRQRASRAPARREGPEHRYGCGRPRGRGDFRNWRLLVMLPSMRPRGRTDATFRSADQEYSAIKGMIAFWDMSENPADNSDPEKKLGRGDTTHGMAFTGFDATTLAMVLADGESNGTDVQARAKINPDNWALRLHSQKGRRRHNTWDVRLVVDDVNRDSNRRNQSTMLIDQCDQQHWSFIRDFVKIRELAATNDHDELRFDAAGFLGMISGAGTAQGIASFDEFGNPISIPKTSAAGPGPGIASFDEFGNPIPLAKTSAAGPTGRNGRACTMQNISRRGGYITDGKLAAQLWHIITIAPPQGGGARASVITGPVRMGGDQAGTATRSAG